MLEVLARHRVQFVAIGNYAGMLAGAEVFTEDVDITPATTPENLERLAAALAELQAGIRLPNEPPLPLPQDPKLLATAQIWNLTTRYGDLDIATLPSGTEGYRDLSRGAQRLPISDRVAIDVASLEDVIRSKTAADRPKDRQAIPQLRQALTRVRSRGRPDLGL